MALRWYTTVIDCRDHVAQARWWAKVLHWQVVHESDEEAVAVPMEMSADPQPRDKWDLQRPGLVFVPVPEAKHSKNRLHVDLATHVDDDRDAELARLTSLGAREVSVGQTDSMPWTVFADPEDNEFCVLDSREF